MYVCRIFTINNIEKEIKNPNSYPNSLLSAFVKALDISNEDFLLAAKSGTASTQETARSRIRWMVDTKINRTFNDFYKTEEIYLDNPFYIYHRNN